MYELGGHREDVEKGIEGESGERGDEADTRRGLVETWF